MPIIPSLPSARCSNAIAASSLERRLAVQMKSGRKKKREVGGLASLHQLVDGVVDYLIEPG
jgi:hypothetical protein